MKLGNVLREKVIGPTPNVFFVWTGSFQPTPSRQIGSFDTKQDCQVNCRRLRVGGRDQVIDVSLANRVVWRLEIQRMFASQFFKPLQLGFHRDQSINQHLLRRSRSLPCGDGLERCQTLREEIVLHQPTLKRFRWQGSVAYRVEELGTSSFLPQTSGTSDEGAILDRFQ